MTKRNFMRIDESNVDEHIDDLIKRTKGDYIMQGVAFSKTCKRQLALLRWSLLESSSFSGLVKELIALKINHILNHDNNNEYSSLHKYTSMNMHEYTKAKTVESPSGDNEVRQKNTMHEYTKMDKHDHVEEKNLQDDEDTFLLT